MNLPPAAPKIKTPFLPCSVARPTDAQVSSVVFICRPYDKPRGTLYTTRMNKTELQHSLREIHTLLNQAIANHDKNRGAIDELIDQAEEKLNDLEAEIAEDFD